MSLMDGNTPDQSPPAHLEDLLSQRPELLAKYKAFYTTLCRDESVPDRMRELCRLRVAAVHGCEAEWQLRNASVTLADDDLTELRAGRFDHFEADERAALSVADTLPFGQHALSDDQMSALREAVGERGTVALLTECAFFDVVCRWKIAFEVDARARMVDDMPLDNGVLA